MIERTLVFVKPEHVEQADDILAELDEHARRVCTAKVPEVPLSVIQDHYSIHQDKPWYGYYVASFAQRPVVLAVYEGEGIIKKVRELIGPSDPSKAPPDTIRGRYGDDSLEQAFAEDRACRTVIHASDSLAEAERELEVWKRYLDI